eukprot:snap_masked-scaffold_6-processed-gene-2.14-mRNA-1 protein AED:1.00 eAED:1.00 QI:0/0/0/0/1/1/2/0/97
MAISVKPQTLSPLFDMNEENFNLVCNEILDYICTKRDTYTQSQFGSDLLIPTTFFRHFATDYGKMQTMCAKFNCDGKKQSCKEKLKLMLKNMKLKVK